MSYPPLPSSKDITSEQFLTYYLLYKSLVAYLASKPRRIPKFTPEPPSNLCDLDEIRFDSLSAILKEREAVDGQAWIAKEELQELVAWKLYMTSSFFLSSHSTNRSFLQCSWHISCNPSILDSFQPRPDCHRSYQGSIRPLQRHY